MLVIEDETQGGWEMHQKHWSPLRVTLMGDWGDKELMLCAMQPATKLFSFNNGKTRN